MSIAYSTCDNVSLKRKYVCVCVCKRERERNRERERERGKDWKSEHVMSRCVRERAVREIIQCNVHNIHSKFEHTLIQIRACMRAYTRKPILSLSLSRSLSTPPLSHTRTSLSMRTNTEIWIGTLLLKLKPPLLRSLYDIGLMKCFNLGGVGGCLCCVLQSVAVPLPLSLTLAPGKYSYKFKNRWKINHTHHTRMCRWN